MSKQKQETERSSSQVEWKNDFSFQYRELDEDVYIIQVEFQVRRSRLEILKEICELKYSGILPAYVVEALYNQIESDLKHPETIATHFCERKLNSWIGYPASRRPTVADFVVR
jgi:hypothetical protein